MINTSHGGQRIAKLELLTYPFVWRLAHFLGNLQTREISYQNIFFESSRRLGIDIPFYPIGGAANASLLYLILRVCLDSDVRSVLELGVGQSTILLHELRKLKPLEITSVEHDAAWAGFVGKQVDHEVIVAPLRAASIDGVDTQVYDVKGELGDRRFDLMIVDGPVGFNVRRRSRWGCIEFVRKHLADDYVMIIDDAHRRGEMDTVKHLRTLLDARGPCHVGLAMGACAQIVLASERFRHVVMF